MNVEALAWFDLGWTPVPVRTDGTKAPTRSWRAWQHQRPTREQVEHAFAVDHDGFGVLTGTSREDGTTLLMIEAEGRAVTEGVVNELAARMDAAGLGALWARVTGGYAELTPTNGIHWYVVVAGPCGRNAKLASRPATDLEQAERPGARVQVLLETRGEGGFTVVAPSGGRSHPTGLPWRAIVGTPASIPTVTTSELERLLDVMRGLDQMPAAPHREPVPAPTAPSSAAASGGLRPGDDYMQRTSWHDILVPRGWTPVRTIPGAEFDEIHWVRPGKDARESIGATTGHADDGDRLYVFSTSTEFEAGEPYDKLGALALLEHGGDLGAAVRALGEAGYGRSGEADPGDPFATGLAPSTSNVVPISAAPSAPRVEGATALAVQQSSPAAISDLDLARFGKTEDGVARALVARCADRLRYCPQRGLWLTWNGSRWAWDEGELHRELARQLARDLPDNDTWKAFRSKMLSSAGISGVVRLARTDVDVTVHIDDLDSHPWQLNTPGGIIDMRTGELTPADRAQMHTRTTTVTPDYESPAPVWEGFLRATFGGDEQMIAYVQRLLGVTATGVAEQVLPFALGVGANGKSTLMETVISILGLGREGYATAMDAEALMVRRHSEHPAELAQLAGARMVVCQEIEEGQRFAEARVKQLTGGDSINARFMRGNPFTFKPSHVLWLVANHKPATSAGGRGFWRRVQVIPFDHVVEDHQIDKTLPDKLAREAPQILAWVARGAAAYHEHGLGVPEAVTAATGAYQADQDSVGKFVTERCLRTPQGRVKASELRAAYEAFCRESGDSPVGAKRFGEQLRDQHGVSLAKSGSARLYAGITLYADESEADESPWGDR